jgi:integrase
MTAGTILAHWGRVVATIRRRGPAANPRYHIQIRRTGHRRVTKTFRVLADAKMWARQMEARADREDLPPDTTVLRTVTLRELVARYKDTVSIRKRSAATEQDLLDVFLRQPICSRLVLEIRPSDFARYRDERLQQIKPSSLRRELAPVRHMFEVAKREWGLPIRQNPVAGLAIEGADRRRERRLHHGELEMILQAAGACQNKLIAPIIAVAVLTGMRRGEILAMRWANVDYQRKTLLIPISKNGQSRTIPLFDTVAEILNNVPRAGDCVFPISGNALRLAWERIKRRANITDLHFHDLRHEAISRFFEAGLSIAEVALISGHRDARMLFRYTHPQREQIIAKMKNCDQVSKLIPSLI